MIVAAEVVAGFRDTFGGEVLGPEDSGYDTARSVWNGDIDRRPALIVRPRTISEVAAALGLARTEGLEVSVRGGGHSYAGHAVCDDGLMIDLSAMSEVSVDAESRRARCGGGATWLHLDAATQAHALGVTGGFISHTGVGGLTLGGGMGWLTRRAGLTCDSLVSAEVVTADGQTVTASAESNPDLFWALRGGGGNFGIVTSFEFALHEVAPLANLGLFFWDPLHGREGLRFARDLIATLPEDMGALVAGLSAPPAPFVPPEYQGQPGFVLAVVGWGSAEDHAAVLEPVTSSAPEPQWQMISPIPYTQLQQMFDESAPWGALAYEKALYLDDLSEEVIDIFADFLPRKASPLSFVPVFPMGGAFNRVAEEDTAFGGSRRTGWVFNISAACLTPEMLDADRAWVREFWAAMRPHSAGPGGYVNFLSDADQDRVRASYGKDKYDRLARIKAHWDPENIFHRNANIRPTV